MITDLTQLQAKQQGIVSSLAGGQGMIRRLDAMGIRPGVIITKLSSQLMQGPVIVRVGTTQIALGYGMARKILIKPLVHPDTFK